MLQFRKITTQEELNRVLCLSKLVYTQYCELTGYPAFTDFLNRIHLDDGLQIWGCFDKDETVGTIAVRDSCHICLLFVEKEFQRRYIGQNLVHTALDFCETNGASAVTVNASPNSARFYRKMGFASTGAEQIQNGIHFIPMQLSFQDLPVTIGKIESKKEQYLNLLLEADPSVPMIQKYLPRGDLFVLRRGIFPVCAAVVLQTGPAEMELKNISSAVPQKGYGTRMMNYLFEYYRGNTMTVGTGNSGINTTHRFYQKFGFSYTHTLYGFFTDNYPEPIYENGMLCSDLVYFKKEL